MARPPASARPVATAERLLDAAEQVFGAQGFAAARLEDIAATAGVRRSSLLYHFPSKEALYEAVVRRAMHALARTLGEAMTLDAPFADRLNAVERRYLEFLTARAGFAGLVLREVVDGRGPGRAILTEALLPLLDEVDAFFRASAGESPSGVPGRGALLQAASSALVFAAAGPFAAALWGDHPPRPGLAAQLFLRAPRGPG